MTEQFTLLTCVLLLVTTVVCSTIYQTNNKQTCKPDETKDIQDHGLYPTYNQFDVRINDMDKPIYSGRERIREFDRSVDQNSLIAPIMRKSNQSHIVDDSGQLKYLVDTGQIQQPTQGVPDSYQYLGNLHRSSDNKYIKFYGRCRYKNVWDYYGIFNDLGGMLVKVNIETRNNAELFNDDMIKINTFGDLDGDMFQVNLHKRQDYIYYPTIY